MSEQLSLFETEFRDVEVDVPDLFELGYDERLLDVVEMAFGESMFDVVEEFGFGFLDQFASSADDMAAVVAWVSDPTSVLF
jgi:hypothetical protein